jgi:uncharacterized membrane-anchored protein YitT (DUF2179 family)
MKFNKRPLSSSIAYNLLLITLGSIAFGFGVKAIALPHGLITGGMSGLCLLIYYWTGLLSPGVLYFLINIPIFILGWRFVSRRFFFYSLYGMVVTTIAMDTMSFHVPLNDLLLAVLAGGCLMGAGAGIILHSLGSAGGNDVVAVILHQHFNVRIGNFFFAFNVGLFALSLGRLPLELVLYSLAMSFITSQVLEYFLNISNQRKMALIISDHSNAIAKEILSRMGRGATLLQGRGAYTGKAKEVLMTVVHNYQLKRLEELVFSIDADAFVIMENTFNVLGKGFSHRKLY